MVEAVYSYLWLPQHGYPHVLHTSHCGQYLTGAVVFNPGLRYFHDFNFTSVAVDDKDRSAPPHVLCSGVKQLSP